MSFCVVLPSPSTAADAIPGEQYCDVPDGDGLERNVDRIEFDGNNVTRPAIMERELAQRVGDPCSLDRVVDGVQALMDLDLFRSVRASLVLEPSPFGNETLVLRYTVREKIFFLAIPRLSRTSDAELRTGLQLRWDNFGGRLHELKFTAERRQEDDGRGRDGYVNSLEYRVPRFLGSDYGLDLDLASERRQTGFSRESLSFGEGQRESRRFGLGVARWLESGGGIGGLRLVAGVAFESRELEVTRGSTGPHTGGFDSRVSIGLENRQVHRDEYRRHGHATRVRLQAAGAWSGSDFSYHRADLRVSRYLPFGSGFRNLNLQFRLGVSDRAPFGGDTYGIGGGEVMRGVAPGRDKGDMLVLLNVEYLSAFFTRPAWRWVFFVDIGNVYPIRRPALLEQNLRSGLGLRYKLRALTRTDLRLDLAWDPDADKLRTYVATSLTF